ncbi:MAG TPA: late competence development ComFB family protein [Spirochaetia bacterium]
MRLKNYNEDLVLETVKIVLKDRTDIHPTRSFILDVAAYALNRVPPKYITSERGFTREFVQGSNGNGEDGERLLNVIELITLVNKAVDVVARRRRSSEPLKAPRGRSAAEENESLQLTYFYNMPHIFGRVIDASSHSPIIAAEATLWVNGTVAVPAESGWRNPYTTNEQTKGYFSFWPQVEMGDEDSLRVELRIAFAHEAYRPFTFHKVVKVPGEFFVHDYIRSDKLLDIGTLSLEQA